MTDAAVTSIVRDRFDFLFTALVGMVGFAVWQSAFAAAGVSRRTEWAVAVLLAIAGGTVAIVQLVRVRSSVAHIDGRSGAVATIAATIERDQAIRRVVVPIRGSGWRFDDPANVVIDRSAEQLIPLVRPDLERALLDILDNPLVNPREVVRGEVVYIKRLHPSTVGSVLIPALLLAYTAVQRERLIRIRSLAIGGDPKLSGLVGDGRTDAALERLVATARQRAEHGSNAFGAVVQ